MGVKILATVSRAGLYERDMARLAAKEKRSQSLAKAKLEAEMADVTFQVKPKILPVMSATVLSLTSPAAFCNPKEITAASC